MLDRSSLLVLTASLALSATALAQDRGGGAAPDPRGEAASGLVHLDAAVHGGQVHETQAHLVEVVVGPTWVRVYLLDKEAVSTSVEGVSGDAALRVARVTNGRTNHQAHQATLHRVAADPAEGRLRDSLEGSHSLGNEDPGTYEAEVTLGGVAGEPHERISFTVTWTNAPADELATYTCAACAVRRVDPGPCKGCGAPLRRSTPGARTPAPSAPAPSPPRPAPPAPAPPTPPTGRPPRRPR